MTRRRMIRFTGVAAVSLLSLVGPDAAAKSSAQTADAESAEALRQLVVEVRELRAAIERYADAQLQTQAVGELLTVQQRRVSDLTTRVDAARRELDANATEVRRLTAEVAAGEEGLRRVADAKERAAIEEQTRMMKQDLERRSDEEQQLRNRESDLSSSLSLEEAKWNELVDRLNQWLRR